VLYDILNEPDKNPFEFSKTPKRPLEPWRIFKDPDKNSFKFPLKTFKDPWKILEQSFLIKTKDKISSKDLWKSWKGSLKKHGRIFKDLDEDIFKISSKDLYRSFMDLYRIF